MMVAFLNPEMEECILDEIEIVISALKKDGNKELEAYSFYIKIANESILYSLVQQEFASILLS